MSDNIFTDDPARQFFSPWWFYLLFGLNLIFLSILIIFFPALLSLIVATFMMMDGLLLLGLAFTVLKIKRKSGKHQPGQGATIVS